MAEIYPSIMSVKKAITILDLLIENKTKVRYGVLNLLHTWNASEEDIPTRNAKMVANILQNDVEWLQDIKKYLLPEQHRTKIVCSHPKKDQDVCGGQRYCMNCNMDL